MDLLQGTLLITDVGIESGVKYIEKEIIEQNSQASGSNIALLSMGIQRKNMMDQTKLLKS